jgi:Prolyl oligopeptidase, N-terminal beta-propeller domain
MPTNTSALAVLPFVAPSFFLPDFDISFDILHVPLKDLPYQYGPFEYYSRTEEGKSYRIQCRKAIGSTDEQVILDENEVASGHDYRCSDGYICSHISCMVICI